MTYTKSEKERIIKCIDKMFSDLSLALRKTVIDLNLLLIEINKNLEKLKEKK